MSHYEPRKRQQQPPSQSSCDDIKKKYLETRYKKQLNFRKQFNIKIVKMSYTIVVWRVLGVLRHFHIQWPTTIVGLVDILRLL